MGSNTSNIVYNQEVPNSREKGFSSVYRNPKYFKQLVSLPEPQIRTLKDVILNTEKKYGSKIGLGISF